MRRGSICQKTGLRKGPWTEEEDRLLSAYIKEYSHWNWRELPKYAGVSRCGKSCRLRWMNYLRPDIKRGNFTIEEDEIITSHIKKFGNKWSAIAAILPGRTDNEVKNHWHTSLKKQTEPNAVLKGPKRVKPMKSKRRSTLGNAFHPVPLNPIILESSKVVPLPQQSCSDPSVCSSDSEVVIIENPAIQENEIWLDTDLCSPEEFLSEHILDVAEQKSSASLVSTSDPEDVMQESELPIDTEKDFRWEFSTEPFLLEDAHFWDNNSAIWIDSLLTHPPSLIDEASYAYDLCNDYSMDFLFSR